MIRRCFFAARAAACAATLACLALPAAGEDSRPVEIPERHVEKRWQELLGIYDPNPGVDFSFWGTLLRDEQKLEEARLRAAGQRAAGGSPGEGGGEIPGALAARAAGERRSRPFPRLRRQGSTPPGRRRSWRFSRATRTTSCCSTPFC